MLSQTLKFKLSQKLSPQQIQFIKLLQVPTALLEQRIKQEMEENPALEEGLQEILDEYEKIIQEDKNEKHKEEEAKNDKEKEKEENDDFELDDYLLEIDDTPNYKTSDYNHSPDDEDQDYRSMVVVSETFHERLRNQLGMLKLSEHEIVIAKQIIGSIDDDGYLRRPTISIVDDLAFGQNVTCEETDVLILLNKIQKFDPPGVAARDLRECLLLQLERKEKDEAIENAISILKDYFEEYTKKHYQKLIKALGITEEKLKAANEEIIRLNPKPGNTAADNSKSLQIIPDFIIQNDEGDETELKLKLNARNAPELRVSSSYKDMLKEYKKSDKKDKKLKDTLTFVKQKIDSAKWFIDAIRQRQHTLLTTMQAILEYQYDFFITGDKAKLKPMILKDIAEEVGLDISTISRVANSKYVQTEFGTFLLKSFFSEGIMTDSGEEASSREVKQILQEAINNENKRKPLSDEKLAKVLNEKGYNIARRTVAKYREQLNLPVARLRKEL